LAAGLAVVQQLPERGWSSFRQLVFAAGGSFGGWLSCWFSSWLPLLLLATAALTGFLLLA
jgi:hypothetical protein